MKNVTISMDEEIVARARVEAAREGKSLSRFVAEAVKRTMSGAVAVGRELRFDEREILRKLDAEAAKRGIGARELVADLLGESRPKAEMTAMERFLAAPPMDLLDANGRAPSRDQIYDRDPP